MAEYCSRWQREYRKRSDGISLGDGGRFKVARGWNFGRIRRRGKREEREEGWFRGSRAHDCSLEPGRVRWLSTRPSSSQNSKS